MDLRIEGSRPVSARPQSRINPITGEELPYSGRTPRGGAADNTQVHWHHKHAPEGVRPDGVPALNLGRLTQDDDEKCIPLELDPYKYKLDTPNTASTVSWGTPHSTCRDRTQQQQVCQQQSTRLPSNRTERNQAPQTNPVTSYRSYRNVAGSARRKQEVEEKVVPENLPPPSDRYREKYQQYEQEMRESYRQHTHRQKPSEEEVKATVTQLKLDHPQTERIDLDTSKHQQQKEWTDQPYSDKQLVRKKDVEELEEEKKKNKLIETVMIDQLSRAVISDPAQNEILAQRPPEYYPGLKRGSVRTLHDSRVRTSGTATENLLQRKVRFGARVLTRNGRDAIRELTGFFFAVDNSVTIYEFRQFGKSAKAMPFVKRGVYRWCHGRKKDQPYTLLDVYQGATLCFPTHDQPLPDSMKYQEEVAIRVTDVDTSAKEAVLTEGIDRREKEDVLQQLYKSARDDQVEERYLSWHIHELVRKQCKKRGITVVTGLSALLRKQDEDGSGQINKVALEKALVEYHINIPQDTFDELWGQLDEEGTAYMDYQQFIRAFIAEMSEARKALVRKAFQKIDGSKNGVISKSEMRKFYNAHKHPKVKSGECREEEVLEDFLEFFQHTQDPKQVTFSEFEEYYEGLSLCIDDDQDFVNILRNSWSI